MKTFSKIDDFFIMIERVVVAHRFTYDVSDVYKCMNGRKTYGFVHLLTGELHYEFADGRILDAKAGDSLFLKPSHAYKVTCPKNCEHYTVNFLINEAATEGAIAQSVLCDSDEIIQYAETETFREEVFSELCEQWKRKRPGYRMCALSLVYKLLYDFIRKKIPVEGNNLSALLSPAKEYIETHWSESMSLTSLAARCRMSVTYFRHSFLKIFGISALRYRDSLRLLYAKDYLLQDDYTIAEIAYKCGFNDFNYFSRFFKKHVGISPHEYRLRKTI